MSPKYSNSSLAHMLNETILGEPFFSERKYAQEGDKIQNC